jgi:Integrase core domain
LRKWGGPHKGFVYVAFVIDVFSRTIVGWKASTTAHAEFVLEALDQALYARRPAKDRLIHHSDRASQYLSVKYTEKLADAGIQPSVGSVGDSYDSALAETINGLYKAEVIHCGGPWRSFQDVEIATLTWVNWFNNQRLLEPIGNIPPAELEANYYASLATLKLAAQLRPISLRQTQCGSKLCERNAQLQSLTLRHYLSDVKFRRLCATFKTSLALPLDSITCTLKSVKAWRGMLAKRQKVAQKVG